MDTVRRFLERLRESDEEALAREVREWAERVPGRIPIAQARPRTRVKLAGIVRRITVRPVEGFEALQVVLWDGTGEVSAVWLGRRGIPGLALGSRLVVEGMLGVDREGLRVVNPTFEFG